MVVGELGPLDELFLVDALLKRIGVHKVVMNAMLLAFTGFTSSV